MNRAYLTVALVSAILIVTGFWLSRYIKPTPVSQDIMPTPTPQSSTRPQVEFSTSKGKFVLELRPDVAPQTVANFMDKWSNGYCDGKIFHRVEDWVVQGCDPLSNGTGGNSTLPTETSSEKFTIGAVGVARKASPREISNDSQIFITKTDSQFLNGEYTYFGHVISGQEIVDQIEIGDEILSTNILAK